LVIQDLLVLHQVIQVVKVMQADIQGLPVQFWDHKGLQDIQVAVVILEAKDMLGQLVQ
jgi:hypothetical protein